MRKIRMALCATFVFVVGACSNSEAQGWQSWPQRQLGHASAVVYEQSGEADAQIIVASKTDILQANGVTPSFDAAGDDYDQLAFALSVLWIDIGGEPAQRGRDNHGQPVLSGIASTEDGERAFAAVLTGRGEDGEVRVLLASPETYASLGGAQALDPKMRLPLRAGAATLTDPAKAAPPAVETGPAKMADRGKIPPRPAITVTDDPTPSIEGWTQFGPLLGPVENTPGDPRVARVDAGGAASREEALKAVFDAGNTKQGKTTGFHEVAALPSMDGNQGWLIAGTATRDGERHRFIALVGRYTESGTYYVSSFQAPEAIYAAWGGPTFFVQVAGKSIQEVVTPELIASVAGTAPEQDVQIADMIITQSINVLFAQMTATMGIVSSMQGLSADIATRTDCIMTTGCVPGQDNQGRTIMTFPND